MVSYLIFFINLFELLSTYSDLSCCFIDKDFIRDILNFIVVVKYTIYATFKYILIQMHYYYLMFYTIFVLPHVPFLLFILKYFYVMKKILIRFIRWLKFRSKRRK